MCVGLRIGVASRHPFDQSIRVTELCVVVLVVQLELGRVDIAHGDDPSGWHVARSDVSVMTTPHVSETDDRDAALALAPRFGGRGQHEAHVLGECGYAAVGSHRVYTERADGGQVHRDRDGAAASSGAGGGAPIVRGRSGSHRDA